MKLAPITVFMFRDSEGFASAISQALSSSSFTRLEDSFELSLEGYGIKDHKASGNVLHYLDNHRSYKVSIVIMQHYEPPVLACALNEVLNKIVGVDPSSMPTLLVPFLVESSKVKGNSKSLRSDENRALTYGIQIGQITETMQTLLKKTQEPPSSLRIHYGYRLVKLLKSCYLSGTLIWPNHIAGVVVRNLNSHKNILWLWLLAASGCYRISSD